MRIGCFNGEKDSPGKGRILSASSALSAVYILSRVRIKTAENPPEAGMRRVFWDISLEYDF